MGDHTAYFRTAPGEEEVAFVRLGRAIESKCKEAKWFDSKRYYYGNKRSKKGPRAQRRPDQLADAFQVNLDSLSDVEFAKRIQADGAEASNAYYFDARVPPENEVGGYLRLTLETHPMQLNQSWGDFRLRMDFRLVATRVENEEYDPNSLDSRSLAAAFICGASLDRRPISQIQEFIVSPEGIQAEGGHVFSQYFNSLRAVVAQVRSYQAQDATAEIDSEQKKADLQILDLMSDRELLTWYLEVANHLSGYRARKGGKGLLTSTTDSSGMSLLYAALLKSLE